MNLINSIQGGTSGLSFGGSLSFGSFGSGGLSAAQTSFLGPFSGQQDTTTFSPEVMAMLCQQGQQGQPMQGPPPPEMVLQQLQTQLQQQQSSGDTQGARQTQAQIQQVEQMVSSHQLGQGWGSITS